VIRVRRRATKVGVPPKIALKSCHFFNEHLTDLSQNILPTGKSMLFRLQNVTKTYGPVTALCQLSVDVLPGAVGLLGPNGAGKTTLIRTLLGLIHVDAGNGEVLGMDIRTRRLDIRQAVGFMPEDECLFPAVAGVEFVAYAGELCGMAPADAMQRAHEVLNYVGLDEARYRRVESYSTGMKQRLKLAAAIVHDPRLLILDEPTNGMDPAGRQDMIDLAHDLAHGKNMSVLFSSHLLPDVEAVCDDVIVLGRGSLLAQGAIQALKEVHARAYELRVKGDAERFLRRLRALGVEGRPHDDALVVTLPLGETLDLFWKVAAELGEQIRYLRPQRSSLEDVFLQAVGDRR
jgi:ABC-2 type transport system ATP-binding protein